MDRRDFLRAAGSAATLSLASPLGRTAPADIDELLDILEDTPRSQTIERVVARIRSGVSYEDLLAALTLATVRNVQPYPDVGFKYHAVMVLQALHRTASGMGSTQRWLPVLWGVDYFKEEQADELQASGWTMPARTPTPACSLAQARSGLVSALDHWDLEAADAAVVDFANAAQPREVFELLVRYGARDFRGIGHKAITVLNAHRILALLGWRHREPVLRSVAAALVNHHDDPNPATAELEDDAAWRQNTALRREIPESWLEGRADAAASREMLAVLREADSLEASRAVVGLLSDGVSPMSLWDALHAAAAELMLTDPDVVPLHAQTSSHALHYGFRESRDTATRQLMLLQCAAFIPRFRARVRARRRAVTIDALEPLEVAAGAEALEDIFSRGRRGRARAAGKALSYLQAGGAVQPIVDRVRHYLAETGDNSHHFKFAEAVFENHAWTPGSPWRDRCLAAGFVYFNGPWARSNPTMREARALLEA